MVELEPVLTISPGSKISDEMLFDVLYTVQPPEITSPSDALSIELLFNLSPKII